jgi:hypothetical protein
VAEIKFTLTDAEYRALVKKASDERRAPNDLAAYLVVKALKPRKPAQRKPTTRKAKAS